MNAYSFYLYGSPFFWFSLLFPQRWWNMYFNRLGITYHGLELVRSSESDIFTLIHYGDAGAYLFNFFHVM